MELLIVDRREARRISTVVNHVFVFFFTRLPLFLRKIAFIDEAWNEYGDHSVYSILRCRHLRFVHSTEVRDKALPPVAPRCTTIMVARSFALS